MSRTRGKKGGAEKLRGAIFLSTPHAPAKYPDLMVVRVGPQWPYAVICTQKGQTVAALGGERAAGYETPGGGVAREFSLRRGDRATLVRTRLPHMLGEWRIERAGGPEARRKP
jgi:hypothetical protein